VTCYEVTNKVIDINDDRSRKINFLFKTKKQPNNQQTAMAKEEISSTTQ
jgi:hypothetical protein